LLYALIYVAYVIILVEKRRRYKINDCISELATLLPPSYDVYVLVFAVHHSFCEKLNLRFNLYGVRKYTDVRDSECDIKFDVLNLKC